MLLLVVVLGGAGGGSSVETGAVDCCRAQQNFFWPLSHFPPVNSIVFNVSTVFTAFTIQLLVIYTAVAGGRFVGHVVTEPAGSQTNGRLAHPVAGR